MLDNIIPKLDEIFKIFTKSFVETQESGIDSKKPYRQDFYLVLTTLASFSFILFLFLLNFKTFLKNDA